MSLPVKKRWRSWDSPAPDPPSQSTPTTPRLTTTATPKVSRPSTTTPTVSRPSTATPTVSRPSTATPTVSRPSTTTPFLPHKKRPRTPRFFRRKTPRTKTPLPPPPPVSVNPLPSGPPLRPIVSQSITLQRHVDALLGVKDIYRQAVEAIDSEIAELKDEAAMTADHSGTPTPTVPTPTVAISSATDLSLSSSSSKSKGMADHSLSESAQPSSIAIEVDKNPSDRFLPSSSSKDHRLPRCRVIQILELRKKKEIGALEAYAMLKDFDKAHSTKILDLYRKFEDAVGFGVDLPFVEMCRAIAQETHVGDVGECSGDIVLVERSNIEMKFFDVLHTLGLQNRLLQRLVDENIGLEPITELAEDILKM